MGSYNLPELHIGDLIADIPIIQGGMGVGISLSGLAGAVALAGGIGVISATGIGMLEHDFNTNFREANRRALQREVQVAKETSNGIIGVNILMALSDAEDLVNDSVEASADLIFVGAGLPLKIPAVLLDANQKYGKAAKMIPIVSSGRATKLILRYWSKNFDLIPEAIVVEGPLAGGHLGFSPEQIDDPAFTLENLVPEVIATIESFEEKAGRKIPIIAAGGIYSGADIRKFLELGAAGVQMATRFVTTHECDASPAFKQAYLDARQEDLVIIKSPVGLPGRAIRNQFLDDVEAGVKKPFTCPWRCLVTCDFKNTPYCIGMALTNAKRGNLADGFAFAGANAYRTDKLVSVQELIDTLAAEYDQSA